MPTDKLQPPISLAESNPQSVAQFDLYMDLLYNKINELEERIAVLEGGS